MGELTKCKDDRRYPVEDFRTVQLDGGVHVNANPGFPFASHEVITSCSIPPLKWKHSNIEDAEV